MAVLMHRVLLHSAEGLSSGTVLTDSLEEQSKCVKVCEKVLCSGCHRHKRCEYNIQECCMQYQSS